MRVGEPAFIHLVVDDDYEALCAVCESGRRRERERERERERKRKRERERNNEGGREFVRARAVGRTGGGRRQGEGQRQR